MVSEKKKKQKIDVASTECIVRYGRDYAMGASSDRFALVLLI